MDITAGGLLLLLAVLFVVGSLLNLAEFRGHIDDMYTGLTRPHISYHQQWSAWSFKTDGLPNVDADTQQLLGIPMILVAVISAVGSLLLLTGLATRSRVGRTVSAVAASTALGLAVTLVVDVISGLVGTDSTSTMSLGPAFWIFVVSILISVVALAAAAFGGAAKPEAAPVDSYGRRLTRRAGGLDIAVGLLLIPLAGLIVVTTFLHQIGGTTMWSTWNDKTQFVGVPFVVGAVVALVAAILSFMGHGRTAASASAAALFAAGLLFALDTVDAELFGPVGFGDLGVGAWLLFVATALALIVTVLAIASAAAKPRYRTPYAPAAQQYPGWSPPAPQQPGPIQQGWPQVPPGWVLVPENSVQARQGWTPPPVTGPPEGVAPADHSR